MKNSFLTINCLFMLVLFTVLSGCATQTQQPAAGTEENVEPAKELIQSSGNQLQTIRSRSTLRVGVSIFTPWVMHDNKGKLIGYEADVAHSGPEALEKVAESLLVQEVMNENEFRRLIEETRREKQDGSEEHS